MMLLRVSAVCVSILYVATVPGYAMLFVLVPVTLPLMMYKACMIKLWCIQASIVVMAILVNICVSEPIKYDWSWTG